MEAREQKPTIQEIEAGMEAINKQLHATQTAHIRLGAHANLLQRWLQLSRARLAAGAPPKVTMRPGGVNQHAQNWEHLCMPPAADDFRLQAQHFVDCEHARTAAVIGEGQRPHFYLAEVFGNGSLLQDAESTAVAMIWLWGALRRSPRQNWVETDAPPLLQVLELNTGPGAAGRADFLTRRAEDRTICGAWGRLLAHMLRPGAVPLYAANNP